MTITITTQNKPGFFPLCRFRRSNQTNKANQNEIQRNQTIQG